MSSLKFRGIFQPKSEIQTVFPAENRDFKKKGFHPKNVMKSSVSQQKLRKYRRQTPIWASIYTPVAPSLLISSGHRPCLKGHNFRLGRNGPGMPPPGAGPGPPDLLAVFKAVTPQLLCLKILYCHQHSFQTLVNVSADFLAGIGENKR